MLAAARFLTWTCALEVAWAAFVGTTQSTELIAGLGASVVGAVFVAALRRVGLLRFRLAGGTVASAWRLPGQVVFDFVLVHWILVRRLCARERVRGAWLTVSFDEEEGERGRFRRAFAVALGNETANGLVVDIDRGSALLHSLDPGVSTGRSVL